MQKNYTYDQDYYLTGIGGFHRDSYPVISAHFLSHFGSASISSLLDFGCGDGFWGHFLGSQCQSVHGVDYSDVLQDSPNKDSYERIYKADLSNKWESPQQYDLLFSVEVIEHVEDYHVFLHNAHDALKPQGMLFLTTTTYFWSIFTLLIIYRRQISVRSLWEFYAGLLNEKQRSRFTRRFWDYFGGHYHNFTKSQLRRSIASAGFDIVSIRYLYIQDVFPVHYFDQPYNGRFKWLAQAGVPLLKITGNLINWLCTHCGLYAPNVLVVARKSQENLMSPK